MLSAAIIFLSVSIVLYAGLGLGARRRRARLKGRLENFSIALADPGPKKKRAELGVFAALDKAIRGLSLSAMIRRELNKANWSLKISEFIIIVILSASFVPLFFLLLTDNKTITVLLIGAGAALPVLHLRMRQSSRRKLFAGQLLDSITLISNSLKSGYSFLQAIDLVAREMSPPISEEYQKVLQEIKLGIPFERAVDSMTKRVANDDLELVMTSVKIQREVGGNLSEILDNIAHTIRERIRIKGQIQTLTAQGRLSGMILSLLPVALGLVLFLLNSEYISTLFTHPAGRAMMLMAVVSQIMGVLMIRKIVNIKV